MNIEQVASEIAGLTAFGYEQDALDYEANVAAILRRHITEPAPVEVTAQDVIDADDVFVNSDGTAQQAADIINARLRDRAPNTVECPTCGRVSFGSHSLAAMRVTGEVP